MKNGHALRDVEPDHDAVEVTLVAQPDGRRDGVPLNQLRMAILDNRLDNMTTYGRYKSP